MRLSCASYDAAAELLAFGASYALVRDATGIPPYTLAVIAETVPCSRPHSGRPFVPNEDGLQRIGSSARLDLARVLAAVEEMIGLGNAPLESLLAAYRLYTLTKDPRTAPARIPLRMVIDYATALFGLWGRQRTEEIRLLRCERCHAPVIVAAHVLMPSKACRCSARVRNVKRQRPALPEPPQTRPQKVLEKRERGQ
ncbi:MAG TPA: hypothetical protein VNK91_06940 [Burkholderiaceae bacterium]|nr:hypothetical protein [Burkholderiaceae bacterium]